MWLCIWIHKVDLPTSRNTITRFWSTKTEKNIYKE